MTTMFAASPGWEQSLLCAVGVSLHYASRPDESVMSHDCPEFGGGGGSRGGGVKAVEGYRSPSPGGTPARLREDVRPWGLRQMPESKCQVRSCYSLESQEIPESGCDFILQAADGEWLMRYDCPELRDWSSATSGIPSRSPQEKAQLDIPTDKPAPQRGSTGDGAPLGLEGVGLGWVSIKMPALRAFGVGQKSALRASDLWHIRAVPGPAGRNIYSQRAEPMSAPFRGGINRESRTGYPQPEWDSDAPIQMPGAWEIPESGCDFILQAAGSEWLMRNDCPEFRNWGSAARGIPWCCPWEKARLYTPANKPAPQRGSTGDGAPLGLEDALLGWVSIQMPALRAFGVWHKSALRASDLRRVRAVPGPAGRNIYSERAEPRSAPFRGGITRKSRTGYPQPECDSDTPIEMPGASKIPESGCDFILQAADDEWLMRYDCPGIGRGKDKC